MERSAACHMTPWDASSVSITAHRAQVANADAPKRGTDVAQLSGSSLCGCACTLAIWARSWRPLARQSPALKTTTTSCSWACPGCWLPALEWRCDCTSLAAAPSGNATSTSRCHRPTDNQLVSLWPRGFVTPVWRFSQMYNVSCYYAAIHSLQPQSPVWHSLRFTAPCVTIPCPGPNYWRPRAWLAGS